MFVVVEGFLFLWATRWVKGEDNGAPAGTPQALLLPGSRAKFEVQ